MNVQTPLSGFQDQAFDSNKVFRTVLDVLSRPGKVVSMDLNLSTPAGLNKVATAFVLALADMETPVWISPDLNSNQIAQHIRFHTGAPITETPEKALFAITTMQSDLSFLDKLNYGTPEMPDQSATVIVLLDGFEGEDALTLSGPGIKDTADLSLNPLPQEFLSRIKGNARLFPCGIDFIFTTNTEIAALPRSTRIEA